METRICKVCKIEKVLSDFPMIHKYISRRCKQCKNNETRDWHKNWRNENKDKTKVYVKNYTEKKATKGGCRRCNAPTILNHRLCEHHYLVTAGRNSLGGATNENGILLRNLIEAQDYICPYTGEILELGINTELDHIYPGSKYPTLKHNFNNLAWTTRQVNRLKRDKTADELFEMCKEVVEYTRKNPRQ